MGLLLHRLLPLVIAMTFLASGCVLIQEGATPAADGAEIPNPASEYCTENGGRLEIRTAEDGGQVGYCVFEDGSECEEWVFFREECAPGQSLKAQPTAAE